MGCVAMSSMPCYVSDSNKFDMNALCPWMGNENGRKRERKTSFLSCVWVRQHTCFMAPNPRSVPGKNRPITFDLDDREFDDLCFCAHALNHRVMLELCIYIGQQTLDFLVLSLRNSHFFCVDCTVQVLAYARKIKQCDGVKWGQILWKFSEVWWNLLPYNMKNHPSVHAPTYQNHCILLGNRRVYVRNDT